MHRMVMQQARSWWSLTLARPGGEQYLNCCACLHSVASKKQRVETLPLPFQWLRLKAPEFRVNGDDVRILHEPSEFYETIKEGVEFSKERVILASLYLGNGPMEKELVRAMQRGCKRAEREGDDLNVHVLLDCVRGSRGSDNSRTMLLPLLQEYGSRVSVSLYHTPELRGMKKAVIPERFNEAIGLSHLKVYAFDDTLLMSGANLSEMYFTNRQDRYVLIRNCPDLVTFFSRLVLGVSSLAFQLHPDNSLSLYSEDSIHPFEGDLNEFKLRGHRIIQNVLDSAENDTDSHVIKRWQRTVLDRRPGSGDDTHRTMREHHLGSSYSNLDDSSNSTLNSSLNPMSHLSSDPGPTRDDRLTDVARSGDRTTNTTVQFPSENGLTGKTQNGECNSRIEKSVRSNINETRSIEKCNEKFQGNAGAVYDDGSVAQRNSIRSLHQDGQVNVATTHNHGNTIDKDGRDDTTNKSCQERTSTKDGHLSMVTRNSNTDAAVKDTAIFPLVQMGPLGITVDEEVTHQLLGDGDEDAVCYLASGYFNLTSEYLHTILDSRPTFEILMASPQVNGFYGSRGISGYIPASYTFISRQFHQELCFRMQQRRIRLYEYYRDAWTFHVKGLWYYLPYQRLPSLTLIGSPNFGHRSVHRDLEAQLAIVTDNESLRTQLHEEQQQLYALSERVDENTYKEPARRVPLWTRLVTIVTRNFF